MSDDKIVLVVADTATDFARNRSLEDLSWVLRNMTANILRVVRGAGKPNEIGIHFREAIRALSAFEESIGRGPLPGELAEMLSFVRDREPDQLADFYGSYEHTQERLARGALQFVASRLIGQRTQEAAGREEMFHAIRDFEAARKTAREEFATQNKKASTKKKVTKAPNKHGLKRKGAPAV